ncbi:alpha/beta fold hydrolase [Microbacterium sp. RD1]|uniref:alpha/beta fold hydrolase n=1 Tax=Microbacterium sp. RD1 TaxID=3457313 RepID=UPI003FA5994C
MEPELSDTASVSSFSHDGSVLVAEAAGAGERTFVLVHGIGMGRSVFADAARLLRRHGHVIAVDLPGYGEAPEPSRTPTIERMADLVAAYLVTRVPGPVVLIGHSLGSQVALEVEARHPGLVSCLVLVAPTVDRAARRPLPQIARLARDLRDEHPKVLFAGAREYLRAGPHLRRKFRAMLAHRPEDSLARVAVPTLVLRGADDPVCPREWCRFVADGVPDGRLEEIPDRGHETLIRDAAAAVALIRAFVAS